MQKVNDKYILEIDKQYKGLDVKTCMSSDAIGKELLKLGKKNKNLVVLTADLKYATKVYYFSKQFPERFFNIGIAEQNMFSIGAGLAACGKMVVIASFSIFTVTRACEQVRTDIAYPNLKVIIIGWASGFSFGIAGPTHVSHEDVAIMRTMPNMTIIQPSDAIEAVKALKAALKCAGPVYIRIGRGSEPVINNKNYNFEIGKAKIIRVGKDATIICSGPMVFETVRASKTLKQDFNVDVEILNIHTIKPIDKNNIIRSLKKTKHCLSVEEHSIIGGLGSTISEIISEEAINIKFKKLGINDLFIIPGKAEELREFYGLDYKNIVKELIKLLDKNL